MLEQELCFKLYAYQLSTVYTETYKQIQFTFCINCLIMHQVAKEVGLVGGYWLKTDVDGYKTVVY